MSQVEFVEPELEHIIYIALNIRKQDRIEIEAMGIDVFDALYEGVTSGNAWVAMSGGRPFCIFGVNIISHDFGVPWLLGTDQIRKNARVMIEEGRNFLKMFGQKLENYVHSENKLAIRYLTKLGFTVCEDQFEIGGHNFQRFYRCAHRY